LQLSADCKNIVNNLFATLFGGVVVVTLFRTER
jgi:hypothetical protein